MNYLLNRVPWKIEDKTSYELTKVGNRLNNTCNFGCMVKLSVPKQKRIKIGPKTIDGILIGYEHTIIILFRFLYINIKF